MQKQHKVEQTKKIEQRYLKVKDNLSERARRLFVASEAIAFGYGGIIAAFRATGMAPSAIGRGICEVHAIENGEQAPLDVMRSRRPGGGRKKLTEKDPTLLPDLKELLESTTRGDPESPLLWTARSHEKLAETLQNRGHKIGFRTIPSLLKKLGYSLQSNRKKLEGIQHPDRNAQFEHLTETVRQQLESGNPAISVDTKKRELVGSYKNNGQELRPKDNPEEVNDHDFEDKDAGHVRPYGVYDLKKNEAWVGVGINHDTAEFAVQTIRTWWQELGQPLYPDASSLLITADAGGSNGYRLRLWKVELQQLADELAIPISVCHFPPGTSKWNKIEHRLFSFITKNWRGKPLVTHEVIVNLISATTTKTGLKVFSKIDERLYPKGRRVTDKQLAQVCLVPCDFHGEWNYTIYPSGNLGTP